MAGEDDANVAQQSEQVGTNVISLVNELQIGDRDARAVAARYQVSADDYLDDIVARLGKWVDRPVLDYNVKLVDGTAQINAFSISGGYLFVSKSLLEQMEPTEGELAFILAHEMAHAALRHLPAMMERSWWSNTLVKINVCQAAASGRISGSAVCPAFEALDVAEYLMNVEAEFAADQFGALYLVQAGYEFSDAVNALRKLAKAMGDVNEFGTAQELAANSITSFPTHPPTSQRIDQLERFRNQLLQVAASVKRAIQELGNRDFESAATTFNAALKVFPDSRAMRLNLALANHLMFRSTQQGFALDRGILSDPAELEVKWADLLQRGGAEPDQSALKRAIDGYTKALALDSDYYPARNNLAVAYLDSGEPDRAITELEHTLSSNRQFAVGYRNLALAYLEKLESAGVDAHESLMESWALEARRAWAEYRVLRPETRTVDASIEDRLGVLARNAAQR